MKQISGTLTAMSSAMSSATGCSPGKGKKEGEEEKDVDGEGDDREQSGGGGRESERGKGDGSMEDKANMTQSVNILNMKSRKELLLSGKWSALLESV